jgi:transcriptional regulator with XRE-family HTH domain
MELLRRERLKQTMKWEDLAARVGVKYQSLQAFEKGDAHPTETTLKKWVRGLGLDPEIAEEWVELRIAEQVRELLEDRRGPRAASPEDIDAAVRYVRRLFGR